ncbi:MAG: hypothetical protein RL028_914, partial [Actinomycetota bacterium]
FEVIREGKFKVKPLQEYARERKAMISG